MIKKITIFLAVLLLNKFQSQSPENSESSFIVILKSQLIAGVSGEKNETDNPTYKFTLKDLEGTESIIAKESPFDF